jgi:hypothetical protein
LLLLLRVEVEMALLLFLSMGDKSLLLVVLLSQ